MLGLQITYFRVPV